jgi:hypothetical protein
MKTVKGETGQEANKRKPDKEERKRELICFKGRIFG